MSIAMIVAMSQNGVIGDHGKLPWHLPEDLKHFKSLTMGHKIVMGRKTFESIGRPLPGRENIVLTRDAAYVAQGVEVIHSLKDLVLSPDQGLFVIGGAEIYRLFLPCTDRLYLTLVLQDFCGDAFFPLMDWQSEFQVIEKSPRQISAKNGLAYEFITAVRNSSPSV